MAEGQAAHPAWLAGAIAVLAMTVAVCNLAARLPADLWWPALWHANLDDPRQLLVAYSFLPRLATALECGAALALAGVIFQQVTRNPLAEPTTLGVSAGAALTLTLALAFAPGLLAYGREWIALAGAGLAMLAVLGLAWNPALSPLALVLAGMIVALYCGAITTGVQLFADPYIRAFYLWGAGSLSGQEGGVALHLLPRLAMAMGMTVLMTRPLTLLGLEDDGARNLGLPLFTVRLAALAIAVSLSAFVVSAVGVIGFIGFASPALARLAGARQFGAQLFWAPLLGAGLLCLTDQLVQWASIGGEELAPTGAATALLGAPLLLWMLPRLRTSAGPWPARPETPSRRAGHPWAMIGVALLGLLLAACVSLGLGQSGHGWHWSGLHDLEPLLRWRTPRLAGALAAGAMLATAGALMQRMTGNPMASPEILGISSGAALGMILLELFSAGVSQPAQLGACALGASAVLAVILLTGRRSGYAPDRILLAGLAISALSGVLAAIVMTSGREGVTELRSWMLGATDLVIPQQAIFAALCAAILLTAASSVRRWLEILPLGAEMARALGLNLRRSRFAILLLTALLTAAATLTVGPFGFVGLVGPHLARMMGLQRPLAQLAGAAAAGALIMVVADWLGRTMLFPYQAPAGLIATLVGGPHLMALLRRRPA